MSDSGCAIFLFNSRGRHWAINVCMARSEPRGNSGGDNLTCVSTEAFNSVRRLIEDVKCPRRLWFWHKLENPSRFWFSILSFCPCDLGKEFSPTHWLSGTQIQLWPSFSALSRWSPTSRTVDISGFFNYLSGTSLTPCAYSPLPWGHLSLALSPSWDCPNHHSFYSETCIPTWSSLKQI